MQVATLFREATSLLGAEMEENSHLKMSVNTVLSIALLLLTKRCSFFENPCLSPANDLTLRYLLLNPPPD